MVKKHCIFIGYIFSHIVLKLHFNQLYFQNFIRVQISEFAIIRIHRCPLKVGVDDLHQSNSCLYSLVI
uniref:Uncharacterized protein n=1 Tax=Lepeophtheirus salmonis TaxID=72036 RepID=A0A0K2UMB3_LEPSM